MAKKYDIVIAGSSFASIFFLKKILDNVDSKFRVALIEIGTDKSHKWQLKNQRHSEITSDNYFYSKGLKEKEWVFSLGLGGSSKCWSACTPRMLPNDFSLKSIYGVSEDWPIKYNDIEKYYCEAENLMKISGPSDWKLSYRSKEFPQPAHQFNESDLILKKAFPNLYYQQATARPTRPTGNRPACCGSGSCELCPIDSKFTILNEMRDVLDDSRVTKFLNTEVLSVEYSDSKVSNLLVKSNDQEYKIQGNHFALGMNAIFNCSVLLQSKFQFPVLGKYLHEQVSKSYFFDTNDVDGFSGSTLISGQGYMFYDGEHRSDHGACLFENFNTPFFRVDDIRRLRERMIVKFIVEDLPQEENYVSIEENKPTLNFFKYSTYALKGLDKIPSYIEKLATVLPIDRIVDLGINPTEAHIQGTTRMGDDSNKSVVNKFQVMHGCENLFILGSSTFPTGAPVNPTLTICALSLMSADYFLEHNYES